MGKSVPGSGAQVGAFDEDGDCGPGYFGGRARVGKGRGGGQADNDGGDGILILRFAGFGDEGGDGGPGVCWLRR